MKQVNRANTGKEKQTEAGQGKLMRAESRSVGVRAVYWQESVDTICITIHIGYWSILCIIL